MIQTHLFDGEQRKELGIQSVTENNSEWKERVIEEIIYLAHKLDTFTSDDVRVACQALVPSHCNAWGAVMNAAAKLGYIEKTGQYVKSTLPTNNSRVVPVWRAKMII